MNRVVSVIGCNNIKVEIIKTGKGSTLTYRNLTTDEFIRREHLYDPSAPYVVRSNTSKNAALDLYVNRIIDEQQEARMSETNTHFNIPSPLPNVIFNLKNVDGEQLICIEDTSDIVLKVINITGFIGKDAALTIMKTYPTIYGLICKDRGFIIDGAIFDEYGIPYHKTTRYNPITVDDIENIKTRGWREYSLSKLKSGGDEEVNNTKIFVDEVNGVRLYANRAIESVMSIDPESEYQTSMLKAILNIKNRPANIVRNLIALAIHYKWYELVEILINKNFDMIVLPGGDMLVEDLNKDYITLNEKAVYVGAESPIYILDKEYKALSTRIHNNKPKSPPTGVFESRIEPYLCQEIDYLEKVAIFGYVKEGVAHTLYFKCRDRGSESRSGTIEGLNDDMDERSILTALINDGQYDLLGWLILNGVPMYSTDGYIGCLDYIKSTKRDAAYLSIITEEGSFLDADVMIDGVEQYNLLTEISGYDSALYITISPEKVYIDGEVTDIAPMFLESRADFHSFLMKAVIVSCMDKMQDAYDDESTIIIEDIPYKMIVDVEERMIYFIRRERGASNAIKGFCLELREDEMYALVYVE